ncbi:hypothetical protein [Kiloniella antarctica]|uniref:Uncharacterized protein n=1 Tax=Kiloniella antarctica TaxID=1550907 RepID=A0ABW5BQU5_9PROT
MLLVNTSLAGEADVLAVETHKDGRGGWRFNVTVRHDDTGWDHYANKWDIVTETGEVIATRVLHHPHENEQPFTRSLSSVKIPAGVKVVIVRAHDSVDGYSGQTQTVSFD